MKHYMQKTPTATTTPYVKHRQYVEFQKKKLLGSLIFLEKNGVNCKQIDVAYFLNTIILSLNIVDNRSDSQILKYSVKLASNFTTVSGRRKKK